MARIDNYLRSMARFGARGLLLESDANVLLRFPAGDRHATQTTPHAQLQAMVAEVAPHAIATANEGGSGEFRHQADGKNYSLAVRLTNGKLRVTAELAPLNDDDGLFIGAGDMEIERHSYDGASSPPSTPASPSSRPASPLAVATSPGPAAAPAANPAQSARATSSAGERTSDWIDRILTDMKQADASDLHLSSGSPPYWRLHGEIAAIPGQSEPLEASFLLEQLHSVAPENNRDEFDQDNDTDFAYSVPGLSRFRVNVFRDRNGPGAVFRAIPFEIPTAEQLGLPPAVLDMANLTKGLVLVTGPTGSGKSTTLAALIDHINRTRAAHLITIEDPIEFVHQNKMCLVNQREILTHTSSFKRALRAALREDPDIVLVGEMRDLETIEIAVETAETGHLVFGTLHTTTAPSTVDRIIDQFPTDRQEQIRQMLAKSLRGVVAQVLCRKKGGGRVAAQEILIGTSAVENLIRERKTFQLFSIMQTGRNVGMQTMEDALMTLVKNDLVEPLEAYRKAVNKTEMKNALTRAGVQLDL